MILTTEMRRYICDKLELLIHAARNSYTLADLRMALTNKFSLEQLINEGSIEFEDVNVNPNNLNQIEDFVVNELGD